jgi:membrane associated rhomboid family serine protease
MLTLMFCPMFTIRSFIFCVTILEILVYIPLVAIDFDSYQFFAPTVKGLDLMGAKNGYKMQHKWQLWRWVTPMILHTGVLHIVYNLAIQLIIGFRLEPAIGWLRTAAIYIASGVGGVLLSAVVFPDMLSAGASTSIFGLIGALVSIT